MYSKICFLVLIIGVVLSYPQGEPENANNFPNPELEEAYGKFTSGIIESIQNFSTSGESIANEDGDNSSTILPNVPFSGNSLFGLGHLLAVVNEDVWSDSVSVPIFDDLLQNTPKNTLHKSYDYILTSFGDEKTSNELKSTVTIFSPLQINMTSNLKALRVNNLVMDLTQKDSIAVINHNIVNKLQEHYDMEAYIPESYTISNATKAIIVNTFQLKGTWGGAGVSITKILGKQKFNNDEEVDMLEISGDFQVIEFPNGIEVVIPFQNDDRAFSIFIYKNTSVSKEIEISEPKVTNITNLKVHIPIFNFTRRIQFYNTTRSCNFRNLNSFMELVDEIVYVSLSLNSFDAISIKGAEINDRNEFKKVLNSLKYPEISENADRDISYANDIKGSSVAVNHFQESKLLLVDKPFAWSFLDKELGLMFSGSVNSFKQNLPIRATGCFTTQNNIFGMTCHLSYEKCL